MSVEQDLLKLLLGLPGSFLSYLGQSSRTKAPGCPPTKEYLVWGVKCKQVLRVGVRRIEFGTHDPLIVDPRNRVRPSAAHAYDLDVRLQAPEYGFQFGIHSLVCAHRGGLCHLSTLGFLSG